MEGEEVVVEVEVRLVGGAVVVVVGLGGLVVLVWLVWLVGRTAASRSVLE